ncbi:MAG: MinD/ParA family protein [Myxococcota bacterium]|nr:MinD/ParA family protein [Myxococcota bacterium]
MKTTREAAPDQPAPAPIAVRGLRTVAAVSGKGGVGKTNLMANLAIASASLGARVLLVDGDLGLANVDVLLGLSPEQSLADVLEGRCSLDEALVAGPRGIHVLPAASARQDLAALDGAPLSGLRELLRRSARDYDLVLIDAGAGIGPTPLGLAVGCDPVLVVTTPEPISLADAYATLKVVHQTAPGSRLELVVNSVRDETEARRVHAQLERVTRRFLGLEIGFRGHLPHDPRLVEAVRSQQAVVEAFPNSAVARRMASLAAGLLRESRSGPRAMEAGRDRRPPAGAAR